MNAAKPARPVPSKTIENGSGTAATVPSHSLSSQSMPLVVLKLIVTVRFVAEGANAVFLLNDTAAKESV